MRKLVLLALLLGSLFLAPSLAFAAAFQVTATAVNIRAGASTQSPILGRTSVGDAWPVVAQRGGWVEILYRTGTAWIAARLGRTVAASALRLPSATRLSARPSATAATIARLPAGTLIERLGQNGAYLLVATPEGTGYVPASAWVAASGPAPGATVVVVASAANLRLGPGLTYPVASVVKAGTTLTLVRAGTWDEVRYDGRRLYVASWLVSERPPTAAKPPGGGVTVPGATGSGSSAGTARSPGFALLLATAQINTPAGPRRLPAGTVLPLLRTAPGSVTIAWGDGSLTLAAQAVLPLATLAVATTIAPADLRASPTDTAVRLDTLSASTPLLVLGRLGDWAEVSQGGRLGYVPASALSPAAPLTPAAFAEVAAGGAALRATTQPSAPALAELAAGEPVLRIGPPSAGLVPVAAEGAIGYVAESALNAPASGHPAPLPPVEPPPVLTRAADGSATSLPTLTLASGQVVARTDAYGPTGAYRASTATVIGAPLAVPSDPPTPLAVTATAETGLRLLPGVVYSVYSRPAAGTPLALVGSRDGWLRLETPQGLVAWDTPADVAVSLAQAAGPVVGAYDGGWTLAHLGGRVDAVAVMDTPEGTLLDVSGELAGHSLSLTPDGSGLVLALPDAASTPVAVAPPVAHVTSLQVDTGGLLLRTDGPLNAAVVTDSASEVTVLLRQVLDGLALTPTAQGTAITVSGSDLPPPTVHHQGTTVTLAFAHTSPRLSALPAAAGLASQLQLAFDGNDTVLTVTTAVADAVRIIPVGGGYELLLETPGVAGKTIVLDPGHGGYDTGAIGIGGLEEASVNLAVANAVAQDLAALGAKVILTHSTLSLPWDLTGLTGLVRVDRDLDARDQVAASAEADLFLSIHANWAASAAAEGTSAYWGSDNLNAALGARLAADLAADVPTHGLGTADDGASPSDFYVVEYAPCPAALVETGFLTNPSDAAKLASPSGTAAAAAGIAAAVVQYFSGL